MSLDDTKTAFFQAPRPDDEGDEPRLLVVGGPLAGQMFCLRSGATSVGRRDGNDIILRTAAVSKHHATFKKNGDCTFQIVDEGSINGVLLNDRRLDSGATVDLTNGDTITMAEHVLFFSVPCGKLIGADFDDLGIDRAAVSKELTALDELLDEARTYRRSH